MTLFGTPVWDPLLGQTYTFGAISGQKGVQNRVQNGSQNGSKYVILTDFWPFWGPRGPWESR